MHVAGDPLALGDQGVLPLRPWATCSRSPKIRSITPPSMIGQIMRKK